MVVKFGLFDAGNDWWWAVDNISVFTGLLRRLSRRSTRPPAKSLSKTGILVDIDINGYEITSESGSLNPSAWATTNLGVTGYRCRGRSDWREPRRG